MCIRNLFLQINFYFYNYFLIYITNTHLLYQQQTFQVVLIIRLLKFQGKLQMFYLLFTPSILVGAAIIDSFFIPFAEQSVYSI